MKKKCLSLLLVFAMMLGLMPSMTVTAAAADTDGRKAVAIGTSAISGYDSESDSYDYIYYGGRDSDGVKWRVLSDQTSMGTDGLFLLMEKPIADVWWIDYNPLSVAQGSTYYYTSGQGMSDPTFGHNMWGNSAARVWCRAFTEQITASTTGIGENDTLKAKPIWSASYQAHQSEYDKNYQTFTDAERAQIMLTATTANSEKVQADVISYPLIDYGLKGDYLFFLSANEATDAKYGLDKGANRWTPSVGYNVTSWYTRSYAWFPKSQDGSGDVYDIYIGAVSQSRSDNGKIWGFSSYYIPYESGGSVAKYNYYLNARPGMNLSKENVALTSAADGTAQKSFGLADDYTGNEWKLTLQTSDSFDATLSSNSLTDGGITVTHPALDSYSGAYSYDVVTAALTDENDEIVAYGSLTTDDTTSTLPLPEGIADGEYTLKNGAKLIVGRGLGDSGSAPRINNVPVLVIVDVN